MTYSLKDIENIKNNISKSELELDVKNKLDDLVKKIKTNNSSNKKSNSHNWEVVRNFKVTNFKKETNSAIDKLKNTLKIEINKITSNNFELIKNKVKIIFEENLDDELIIKELFEFLYSIVSKNNFNSKINVLLIKELIKIDKLNHYFNDEIKKYKNIFEENSFNYNKYVKLDNYDSLCDYNKNKDSRINNSEFLRNLYLIEILDKNIFLENLFFLQAKLNKFKTNELLKNEVIELSQHIFIILNSDILQKIKDNNNFDLIISNLNLVRNCKTKDYVGLCNKVIFQHMDILDLIKN